MASFFRMKIARKIASSLKSAVYEVVDSDENFLSKLIKVNRERTNHPQLVVPVSQFLKSTPRLANQFNSSDVLRSMRNEGLPTAEGIIDIELVSSDGIDKFIFTVDRHVFIRVVLLSICDEIRGVMPESCLFKDLQKETVVVVFKSPAVGSEFTYRDFRFIVHTNFVANLCELIGHKVVRVNHIKDWGPTFSMFLAGFRHFGQEMKLNDGPLNYLSQITKASYTKYSQDSTFKTEVSDVADGLENENFEMLHLKKRLLDIWMKETNSIFKRLNVEFSDKHFDSSLQDQTNNIMNNLLNQDIRNSNTDLLDSSRNSIYYDLVSQTATTSKLHNLYHFSQLYCMDHKKTVDIFQNIRNDFTDTSSHCHGNVHYMSLKELDDSRSDSKKLGISYLLDEVKTKVLQQLQHSVFFNLEGTKDDLAESLSLAALTVDIAQYKRNHRYGFNFNDVISYGQNNGMMFQVQHADLHERIGDAGRKFIGKMLFNPRFLDLSPLVEQEALLLVQHLAKFDEILSRAFINFEPSVLVQYMHSLCYFTEKATSALELDEKEFKLRVNKARLVLFYCTQIVLSQCLRLLGLQPLEKFR